MYIPAHFAATEDLDQIAAFVERVGTADLVTFDGDKPIATLIPIIWERPGPEAGKEAGHGRLLGHIALQNPQWRTAAPGAQALAIVDGPQAYVSPSWYQSTKDHGRTVPTWNYTSVHFTGDVTFHQDSDWLRDVVTRLTERYERGREGRWWVTDAPEKFIAGQLRAIVGVELVIRQLEAKEKLSQNRDDTDRANVIAALGSESDPQAREIADLMKQREALAER
ncbi:MAG TPA: FMN-binding negative transcriptional regulator [Streptosporangiaceae bacterium]|jgi:transcriptional regulator|nr:FMN-binding negative transcriptional regulator [Streptosporangiaceae bacterium]